MIIYIYIYIYIIQIILYKHSKYLIYIKNINVYVTSYIFITFKLYDLMINCLKSLIKGLYRLR